MSNSNRGGTVLSLITRDSTEVSKQDFQKIVKTMAHDRKMSTVQYDFLSKSAI